MDIASDDDEKSCAREYQRGPLVNNVAGAVEDSQEVET